MCLVSRRIWGCFARLGLLLLLKGFFSSVRRERVATNGPGWSGSRATGYDVDYRTLDIRLWVKKLGLVFVEVLSRIGSFVFKPFHKLVESSGQYSTQEGTNPVYLHDV